MAEGSRKITVKHYLNTRAVPKVYEGENFYPLYVQIIAAGNKAQVKSKISEYLHYYSGSLEKKFHDTKILQLIQNGHYSENLYEQIYKEKLSPLYNIFEDELELISKIISSGKTYRTKAFSLVNFSSVYQANLRDINDILNDALKKLYLKELNRLFLLSAKDESNRKLFKVTNYFIHFINWSQEFCDYYEQTFEVLPSELKFIENYLSEEIKKNIKSVLAFRSKYSMLKRHLDKIEKGKFPELNYFDWNEEGRDFILKELVNLFGKHKALDYIQAIDLILNRELRIHVNI